MPVYFIRDSSCDAIKIGRSNKVRRRVAQLQTGNPNLLELMGWIESGDDVTTEGDLHRIYQARRGSGEWFSIDQDDVLRQLQRFSGFVPVDGDSFEIEGYDQDGVPEHVGVCKWASFEYYECCPFCGCLCGMHFQEASGMYYCMQCDTLTDFSEFDRHNEEE